MLVIRLARGGRTKYPVYRIVAAESSRAATGKFVEILGHYNPHTKELVIKKEETVKRLSHGAQPSNSVIKLLQRENIELPAWVNLKTKSSKPKSEPEEAPESPAPAAAAESTDAEADSEERVTEAATENAAVVESDPDAEVTETAETVAEAADAAERVDDAGGEVADEAAKEQAEK